MTQAAQSYLLMRGLPPNVSNSDVIAFFHGSIDVRFLGDDFCFRSIRSNKIKTIAADARQRAHSAHADGTDRRRDRDVRVAQRRREGAHRAQPPRAPPARHRALDVLSHRATRAYTCEPTTHKHSSLRRVAQISVLFV